MKPASPLPPDHRLAPARCKGSFQDHLNHLPLRQFPQNWGLGATVHTFDDVWETNRKGHRLSPAAPGKAVRRTLLQDETILQICTGARREQEPAIIRRSIYDGCLHYQALLPGDLSVGIYPTSGYNTRKWIRNPSPAGVNFITPCWPDSIPLSTDKPPPLKTTENFFQDSFPASYPRP